MRINDRNNDLAMLNGESIEDVEKFVHLGVTVSEEGGRTDGIDQVQDTESKTNCIVTERNMENELAPSVWVDNGCAQFSDICECGGAMPLRLNKPSLEQQSLAQLLHTV